MESYDSGEVNGSEPSLLIALRLEETKDPGVTPPWLAAGEFVYCINV